MVFCMAAIERSLQRREDKGPDGLRRSAGKVKEPAAGSATPTSELAAEVVNNCRMNPSP